MSTKKKPRKQKKYRPSVGRLHISVGNQQVFGNLTLFLHHMRHSEIVYQNGRAVVQNAAEGTCYDAYEVLVLFAFFIKHMGAQVKREIDTSALLVMAGLIDLGHDVHEDTMRKVERISETGQAIASVLTYDQVRVALDLAISDRDEYIS